MHLMKIWQELTSSRIVFKSVSGSCQDGMVQDMLLRIDFYSRFPLRHERGALLQFPHV